MNCKKAKLLSVLLLSIFATVSLYASGLKNSAPVVKRKPIMTVEYEYSRSGRITARKINGARQNYKYDKKGQLLGVYDGKGNAIEEYVYDPAGNILKKTIQGKTTTYKYDKANQLVLSECNGKITKYEYDAAGRLVKEGDKVYSYIGLDKIESVTENGRRLSSFTYHIDGQLAARVSIESSEEFQWDGLALIQRNSTSYVNEPAVTGGNPILADDKVLFNDMLGTTLGIKDGDKVTQNNLTAFGESLSTSPMQDSFFTGKPYIGELGYAFLFRNYRADHGKWNSQDPVALAMALPTAADFSKNSSFVKALGYPDGWNNLAYCNNWVIDCIDWLGGEWKLVSDNINEITPKPPEPTSWKGDALTPGSEWRFRYDYKITNTVITPVSIDETATDRTVIRLYTYTITKITYTEYRDEYGTIRIDTSKTRTETITLTSQRIQRYIRE